MDGLEGALNELLNDPEKLNQLMAVAQSMGLNPPSAAPAESGEPEAVGLNDPTLRSILGAVQQAGGNDRQTALLSALKPYTHGERRDKLEKAFQVARLAKLAKTALNTLPK